jgi:hypothetical protein
VVPYQPEQDLALNMGDDYECFHYLFTFCYAIYVSLFYIINVQ